MNSNTYNGLGFDERALLRSVGSLRIDESIPTGTIVHDGVPYPVGEAVQRAKSAAERKHQREVLGVGKDRSGYTKPGMQPRDKAKAKAARAARKQNRGR